MDLVEKVEQTIVKESLLQPGDSIVVAVSGGPDSIALLHILFLLSGKWKWRLAVAHVNHLFRPGESGREADFVRDFAGSLGLPCEIGVIDVPAYIRETGTNPQAAAREKRYRFLVDAAQAFGASRIALAHHADDQAETVLMRVIRGTGPGGLAGIPIRRMHENVELVRPLLRMNKEELLAYLQVQGLSYCIDSSNELPKYARNRIRLEAMPFLLRYNKQLPEALNRLADMAAEENDFLEGETERVFHRLVEAEGSGFEFSAKAFESLHVALQRRLIKLILNYLSQGTDSLDYTGLELARSAILQDERTNLTLNLSNRIRLQREYDRVGFMAAPPDKRPEPFVYLLESGEGELYIPEAGCKLRYFSADSGDPRAKALKREPRHSAVFDSDALRFPLKARSRRDGDRMAVLGLNGSKKVKDIFIDEKIAPGMRNRIPLISDAEDSLLWIPGVRRSVHAQITDKTSRMFCIELLKS